MLKRMAVLAAALVGLAGLAASPAAAQQYPPEENLITVSDTTPCPGGAVSITAKTFTPGSTVDVKLDGTALATATADGAGVITLDATVPETTTNGSHTITATGPGSDNAPLDLTATIDVTSCEQTTTTTVAAGGGGGNLPRTGSDSTMNLVRVGLGLAALGGVLLAVATKRRRRSAHAAAV
jgi:LPXTG-motif cell wall-anchored protein